jgi:hypothetical protein
MPATAEPREAPPIQPLNLLAEWARQGIERFFAAQKIMLDLSAQQNALAIGALRETLGFGMYNPGTSFAEMAGQGILSFINAQKVLLDLASEENTLQVKAVTEGLGLSEQSAAMADLVRRGVDTYIEMQ